MILQQSWRMTWRDWRAKELHFLLLSLIVAVAALSAVGFFVDRLRTGLEQDAHQLLGADLVIRADQPISDAWIRRAQNQDLQLAQTVTFPSMAQSGKGDDFAARLAAIKAVSERYPLRGTLTLSAEGASREQTSNAVSESVQGAPASGTVWADPALLSALGIDMGDELLLGERSFVVTTAYIKTEPVQVALFGFVFLGDVLSLTMIVAIVVATLGVIITAFKAKSGEAFAGLRPTLQGLLAGGFFALSAVCFRGAIIAVPETPFFVAASTALVASLAVQTGVLTLYLAWRERGTLIAIMRAWRPSLFAGFMGAFGSQFWFLAFSLTAAANVRTLALIEVLFAQAISHFMFGQRVTMREGAGIALMLIGVAMLLLLR